MKTFLLMGAAAVALSGCAALGGAFSQLGVSQNTMGLCSELVKAEINNREAPDAEERLKESGMMCLVAALNDVLTVTPAQAPDGQAGTVVATDTRAAAAIN